MRKDCVIALVIASVALFVAIMSNYSALEVHRSATQELRQFAENNCRAGNVERIVIRGALEDAKRRAFNSLPPGPVREREVAAIELRIQQLQPRDCSVDSL